MEWLGKIKLPNRATREFVKSGGPPWIIKMIGEIVKIGGPLFNM